MVRTGIFGGSFNPVHNGHLALARQLLVSAGLDEVWLMVSPQNPLKRQADLLDDALRLELARAAVAGEPRIVASDYEMHLPRPSYTWLTLQALQRDYPERQFTLLIGADNWVLFQRWFHAADIVENFDVCVYPRRDSTVDAHSLPPRVRLVEARLLDVSSTEVRRRVRQGEPIDDLVPTALAGRIARLYGRQPVE